MNPGTKLGGLLIGEQLFSDGRGEVYSATIEAARMAAVVRALPADFCKSPALAEVLAVISQFATCRSPHLTQMVAMDLRGSTGRVLIVTATGNSISLRDRMEKGDLTPPSILPLFRQAMTGLQYAHSKGFAHGDLHPGNILIGADGKVKVANFSFAGLAEVDKESRVDFLAPELASGGAFGVSSDIYALGISFQQAVASIGENRFSKELLKALKKMCMENLADRYTAVSEVLSDLEPKASPAQSRANEERSEGTGITIQRPAYDPQFAADKFERTKTIHIQMNSEMRDALQTSRMPSPLKLAVIGLLMAVGYFEVWPAVKGKNFGEAVASVKQEIQATMRKASGVDKMARMKKAALDAKQSVADDGARKMASATAAADGEADDPEAGKNTP